MYFLFIVNSALKKSVGYLKMLSEIRKQEKSKSKERKKERKKERRNRSKELTLNLVVMVRTEKVRRRQERKNRRAVETKKKEGKVRVMKQVNGYVRREI